MIHLAMPVCDYFGAGTCGKYLAHEFSRRRGVTLYDRMEMQEPDADVDAPLLQFSGPELEQQTKHRGKPNAAYIFSEWTPLTSKQRENLKAFDVLMAGSEWNAQVVREAGFECVAVQQGVDRDVFHPRPRHDTDGKFIIYSGGQLAWRKAQDLVVKAFKVLQQRHDDIVLVCSWVNLWSREDKYDDLKKTGVRFVGLPIVGHHSLCEFMNQTDIGLFPNRFEGGTNLVMMDYLACGKPVIANVSTGQRDVLEEEYAVFIEGSDDVLVEQMVEGVEKLYRDRELLADMGRRADAAMSQWPWSITADKIERAMQ